MSSAVHLRLSRAPGSSLQLQTPSVRRGTASLRSRDVVKRRSLSARADAAQAPAAEPATAEKPGFRPGERKGFVEEMRIKAMKLHTRSQSKEGQQEDKAPPMAKWQPSKEGYIQYLTDNKHVFETMESIMREGSHPSYKEFVDTGLERSQALAKDLAWFEAQGLALPEVGKEGREYAEYLQELAHSNPPAFICHFYNVYFAHSAGGRMIGKKISEMVLDGAELAFYKWDGDLQELLQGVRDKLNDVAEAWSREEKDVCLDETTKSFKYSGNIMRAIFS